MDTARPRPSLLSARRAARALLAATAASAALAGFACSSHGHAAPPAEPAAAAPAALDAEPAVREALERACYDCHSDRGAPPWYAKLSFSYWFAGHAREHLDFSAWDGYDAASRREHLEAVEKTVRDGEMPPWDYTLLLSSAKLRPDEKDAVVRWAAAQAAGDAPAR